MKQPRCAQVHGVVHALDTGLPLLLLLLLMLLLHSSHRLAGAHCRPVHPAVVGPLGLERVVAGAGVKSPDTLPPHAAAAVAAAVSAGLVVPHQLLLLLLLMLAQHAYVHPHPWLLLLLLLQGRLGVQG
jgi:hypothetical protein